MHSLRIRTPSLFPNLVQRQLMHSDREPLLNFRRTIFSKLSNPDLVLPEEDEIGWCNSRLGPEGKCIGLFETDGSLVAYGSLYLPSSTGTETFFSLGGIPKEWWDRITIIDSCMVHPNYRGCGLQKFFIRERCKEAQSLKRPLCVSLTSLANEASRHNLMACGFSIYWIGETTHNRMRQILIHDLSETDSELDPEVTWVPVTNIEQQKLLISDGYQGVCEKLSNPTEIGYAIPDNATI